MENKLSDTMMFPTSQRADQKYITIRFIGGYDFVSRAIQFVTNSLWCHTEALSRDGQSWIGAHTRTGVEARPLDWCKTTTRNAIYAVPVTDKQYEAAMLFLETGFGVGYNYLDILGLLVHNRIGFTSQRAICSQFMLQFLFAAGLQPLNCLEAYSYLITPETLHLSPIFVGRRIHMGIK